MDVPMKSGTQMHRVFATQGYARSNCEVQSRPRTVAQRVRGLLCKHVAPSSDPLRQHDCPTPQTARSNQRATKVGKAVYVPEGYRSVISIL